MSNKIIFGGVDSSTYGIYVSGEGVFNAPVRDAEMISIPGRNGSYLLDHGRFQNIQVRYPVFNQEADKATFIQKIDAFRNAIASLKGYQRLEDTFHSDEYRMASFIGGMEVNPILYNDHSSTFELVFDCKPQRFLTSGETKVSVTSGATITNPTLFDSHPLIEATGYGTINVNGGEIVIDSSQPMGRILVAPSQTVSVATYDTTFLNNGDPIYLTYNAKTQITSKGTAKVFTGAEVTASTNCSVTATSVGPRCSFTSTADEITFTQGTSGTSTINYTAKVYYTSNGFEYNTSGVITITASYDGDNSISLSMSQTGFNSNAYGVTLSSSNSFSDIFGDSTKPAAGNPAYIDLDMGEAYKIQNGQMISLNSFIYIPTKIPVLTSGATNTITFDNTFSKIEMTPRWWKI